jgi:hypothetical protein
LPVSSGSPIYGSNQILVAGDHVAAIGGATAARY